MLRFMKRRLFPRPAGRKTPIWRNRSRLRMEVLEDRTVPSGGISGAIYTSLGDGSTVNSNLYASKDIVYLNGGPHNTSSSGLKFNGSDTFTAVFMVTNPNGSLLLSTDDYTHREVQVVGGTFMGAPGSDTTKSTSNADQDTTISPYHHNGFFNVSNGSMAIQMGIPPNWFDDTDNPGGEYKVWFTPLSEFDVAHQDANHNWGFDGAQKTDNFKVALNNNATTTVCIDGRKFEDLNGNGASDGDQGLEGWHITVWLDSNGNGSADSGETHDIVTSATGGYSYCQDVDNTVLAGGIGYSVTEVQQDGWTETFPGAGYTYTGTLDSNNTTASPLDFGNHAIATISIDKTADPTTVSEGGVGNQDVTYTYNVTQSNAGHTGLAVVVTDTDGPPQPTYVSGDTNGDNLLQKDETWVYTLTVTLTPQNAGATHTNTGTATGTDGDNTTTDTDDATVTYTDVLPCINVVKTADPTTVPEGESSHDITYTYAVTNCSEAGAFDPLSDVTLSDTDGSPSRVDVGLDDDGDDLLEVGETWYYTLGVTLDGANAGTVHTNTATATGMDDEGNTAMDDDDATVTYTDVLPCINVEKTPNVAIILPNTPVIYTYEVTNCSEAGVFDPLSGVSVSDTDGTPTYVSGDDGDNLLEVGETWVYTLTVNNVQANVPGLDLHRNTATATGQDDENNTATDEDTAEVVVEHECGGRTIGFWRNTQGQALLTAADFVALNALNLRNADGSDKDFTGTLTQNKNALKDWLKNADATNMAYMLSAQLTALKLSVLHGFSTAGDYVYVPAINSWSLNPQGSTLLGNLNSQGMLTTAGFINVGTLMATANTALGNDLVDGVADGKVVVLSMNSQRKYYEALKVPIEAINYSYAGSGNDPGPICVSGDTYNYIFAHWHDDDHDGILDPGELG